MKSRSCRRSAVDKARFRLVRGPVDPGALAELRRGGDGALATFVGVVRDRAEDGAAVVGLSYEAYEPMTIAVFEAIGAEIRERFGDVSLAILHAVCDLNAGEAAVAVEATAEHRAAALDACRYAIDQLKLRAPIWKKERYAGGQAQWKANAPGNPAALPPGGAEVPSTGVPVKVRGVPDVRSTLG